MNRSPCNWLYAETDQLAQVAVFGSEGRHDESPGEGMESDEDDEEGEQNDVSVYLYRGASGGEIDVDGNKEQQLYAEFHQVGGDGTQWDDKAWEIDLAENSGIGSEDVGTGVEAVAEIGPKQDARHIEEGLGHAVGGDACKVAENKHEHDGGENGLDEEPQRSEDGLFVNGDDVALHVHIV